MFIQENAFENVVCEVASFLSRPQLVNYTLPYILLNLTHATMMLWITQNWKRQMEYENKP